MRRLGVGVVVLVVLYLTLTGALALVMVQPPARFGRIMQHLPMPVVWDVLPGPRLWLWARRGNLVAGQPAPDFTLPTCDRSEQVTLSDHRGKRAVVLVFGSYT